MCKFDKSIVIVPDGTIYRCIYKMTQNLDCKDCKYNNSKDISPNSLFLAISTLCNAREDQCTFCDCKFFRKTFKFDKEVFIQTILDNIIDDNTFLVFGLFESLVRVDDLIEVLKDGRLDDKKIVVETNGKIFNQELCDLLNKLNIQLIINHHVAETEILQKYIDKVNNIKVEITFTNDNILNEIELHNDFTNVNIVKFRFVNAISIENRMKIAINNLKLIEHESENVRNSYHSFFKKIYSNNCN